MNRLPTYVIIGAMRSGTTALNSYLRQHPDIATSTTKEVHYFDNSYDLGLDWYRSHFPDSENTDAVGEATPNYMFSPLALGRLKETLPEVKLIALLREPADRAYSHYWHDRTRDKTDADFEETVKIELAGRAEGDAAYVARGRYREQIENVLELFDRRSLLVQFFEDMSHNPNEVYAEVCRFIGVDDTFRPPTLGSPVNSFTEFRSLKLRRWAGRFPPKLRSVVGRINSRTSGTYPAMTDSVRGLLNEEFAGANEGLNDLIGIRPPWDSWNLSPQVRRPAGQGRAEPGVPDDE